jgi:SAM-dependent methyltransferase
VGVVSTSTTITACRSCGESALEPVLDLGDTPLANRLLKPGTESDPEPRFPLRVVFCPRCTLVQITETVDPSVLFGDYVYFSSFSDTLLAHSRAHVEALLAERKLGRDNLVIEAASNDGYLLQYFVAAGVPVLGVEPARNIAEVANSRGVRTVCDFFGLDAAERLRAEGHRADVVLGNNVLAHVADLNGFVAGAATLVKDDGVIELEFPYVLDLVDGVEFDTIYHEHLCYFSAHAIEQLFARHGLVFTDVTHLPVHGGSLRVRGARVASGDGRGRVEALLEAERQRGADRRGFYESLARRVEALKAELTATLRRLKSEGKRIVGYGASAKGSTLLNTFGIDRALLDWVADRSTAKQGLLTPGTHLPIVAPERLAVEVPDYALLLTWNFADEIMAQQAAYRAAGGRFIVPVPEVRIV